MRLSGTQDHPLSDSVLDATGTVALLTSINALDTFGLIFRVRMLIAGNAGHFHYREHPDEFVRNVINFVDIWSR